MPTDRRSISDRQIITWRLRHERGWSLRAIALHQGVSISAISQRLRRVEKRLAGRFWTGRHVPRRVVRPMSLSDVHGI